MENTEYSNSLQGLTDTHAKTLKTISDLQVIEKQLYTQLENVSGVLGPDGTSQQQEIINKINNLSDTRTALFNTLNSLYQTSQSSVFNTRNALSDKLVVSKMVENDLNNLKTNMNEISQVKTNKLRLVEINDYYTKRHRAHASIMKLIIFICSIVLVLAILNKKGFIPTNIYTILVIVVLAFGIFYIIRRLIDVNMRSHMNYDQYNWGTMPSKTYGDYTGEPEMPEANLDLGSWSVCGEGTKFDTSKKQCLVASMVKDENTIPTASGAMGGIVSGLSSLTGASIQ